MCCTFACFVFLWRWFQFLNPTRPPPPKASNKRSRQEENLGDFLSQNQEKKDIGRQDKCWYELSPEGQPVNKWTRCILVVQSKPFLMWTVARLQLYLGPMDANVQTWQPPARHAVPSQLGSGKTAEKFHHCLCSPIPDCLVSGCTLPFCLPTAAVMGAVQSICYSRGGSGLGDPVPYPSSIPTPHWMMDTTAPDQRLHYYGHRSRDSDLRMKAEWALGENLKGPQEWTHKASRQNLMKWRWINTFL